MQTSSSCLGSVDLHGNGAGDVALSLNSTRIYAILKSHAIRSEFLLGVLADKAAEDKSEGEEEDGFVREDGHLTLKDEEKETLAGNTDLFLKSKLKYEVDENGRERVMDEEGNGGVSLDCRTLA